MIGTYAAVVAICAASLAIGQGALALCGVRRWSWLAPAVGLALVTALCWGTVRLPGDGTVGAVLVPLLALAAVAFLRSRIEGGGEALRAGLPVAALALLVASLPFAVEGHFGILGTGFNPDMSQHLLAADRLADGQTSELLRQGYPLGPHAIVVTLGKGLGIGLVPGFTGLTVAVAVLASLTALAAVAGWRPLPRTAAALVIGLTYLVASYYAQGAFKETMQALFVLAFVLALRESGRAWRDLPLRFVPAALIAAGSIYAYSFPSLIWLIPIAAIWALIETARTRAPDAPAAGGARAGVPRGAEDASHPSTVGDPRATGPAALALLALAVLVAPELSRMLDFHSFETFDPNGPGLGNLFGQVSPLTALGIWPSGDFRVAAGDGAVPAVAFYLGAAFALALLIYGVSRLWARRESAILAGLAAVALAYLAARLGGTPYTSAKALEIAAPQIALCILLPLGAWRFSKPMVKKSASWIYLAAAGFCALLALANAPVGPRTYSPSLTELRPVISEDSTLVLAPDHLIADEHGTPYIAWELRGGRVCIAAESESDGSPPLGVRFVVTEGDRSDPPYPGLRVRRLAPPYVLWEVAGAVAAQSPCPLIAVRQARQEVTSGTD